MNAGTDYGAARRQAQANADRDGQARKLFLYNGRWWIDRVFDGDRAADGAEIVRPASKEEGR